MPGDITSVHDVPVVVGLAVLGCHLMLAAAVTGVLYAAGDAWMWHRWQLVGGVTSAAAANTALRVAPAVVRRYPAAFTAAGNECARPAFESRPPAGAQRAEVPWPSAGQVLLGRRRARRWALCRIAAVVIPAGAALSGAAWATADVDRLPGSDAGFMIALAAWTALVGGALIAGFNCDRGTARALYPGRVAAVRVVEVALTRRPVSDAWGRRRTPWGPEPGDVVLLV